MKKVISVLLFAILANNNAFADDYLYPSRESHQEYQARHNNSAPPLRQPEVRTYIPLEGGTGYQWMNNQGEYGYVIKQGDGVINTYDY